MTGTYPDSNDDITFWSDVKSLSRGNYHPEEEEMAVLTPKKHSSAHKPLSSPENSTTGSLSTALIKWESPRRRSSYNFTEVAVNLQNSAEKALEDSESNNTGSKQSSICRGVARIVLESSDNVMESSKEYIAGVVRKVARFAQDAGHEDGSNGSLANQVIQPVGNTSLGTMVSFFVIWCVSLCASHLDSNDMPAPALKLAAEEVASVLQSSRSSRSGAPS